MLHSLLHGYFPFVLLAYFLTSIFVLCLGLPYLRVSSWVRPVGSTSIRSKGRRQEKMGVFSPAPCFLLGYQLTIVTSLY